MRSVACGLLLFVVGCIPAGGLAQPRRNAQGVAIEARARPRDRERREVGNDSSPASSANVIAALDRDACEARLSAAGVEFSRIEEDGIDEAIRLEGPIGGVTITTMRPSPLGETMDCRLAVALLAWSPVLRTAGVERIVHFSIHRPHAHVGGSGRTSGHAYALAIDAGKFLLRSGEEIVVERDWDDRTRGEDPCVPRHEHATSAALRAMVCDARPFFHTVLTPHYDAAHGNHVHLEVVTGVDWSYVR